MNTPTDPKALLQSLPPRPTFEEALARERALNPDDPDAVHRAFANILHSHGLRDDVVYIYGADEIEASRKDRAEQAQRLIALSEQIDERFAALEKNTNERLIALEQNQADVISAFRVTNENLSKMFVILWQLQQAQPVATRAAGEQAPS